MAIAACVLASTSCAAPTDVLNARVVSTALATPAPLVRMLRVELDRPANVTVEYWTEGDVPLRVQVSNTQSASVVMTRLRAGHTYSYRVLGTEVTGSFQSDTIPGDLAAAFVSMTGVRTAPLLMLHLYTPPALNPNAFKGYAMTDVHGDVVWYYRTVDFPFGMSRRANGNFVFLDKGRGLVEVSPAGTVVHELAQQVPTREMHHDVIVSGTNTLLFVAYDDRVINGQTYRGDAIWEWTPETGDVAKRWSAWDFFSPDNTPAPENGDWLHVNALALGPQNSVIVGIHNWNQVISVSPDWRSIQWRVGGPAATYAVAAPDEFSGQHTPRLVGASRILMFDNGTRRGTYSRAVEYMMEGTIARVVWEWRSQPLNFASAVGSARRLENGNTMVAFGLPAGVAGSTGPTEVYEVDPSGTAVWHLVTKTQTMFRAEPLTSVGAEVPAP